jgi:hypothetical protein
MKLTNPKSGEELDSPFATHADAATALATKMAERITAGGRNASDFENSMLKAAKHSRGPSAGQAFWLHKIAMPDVAPKPIALPDLAPVHAILSKASAHKKKPAITFALRGGSVKLEWSKSARYKNKVMVSESGFGSPWYGSVGDDGKMLPGRCPLPDEVSEFLKRFASDPAGTAAKYGKDSCRCCFCNRELTKAESKAVGYGAQCADNHGMPWGDLPTPKATAKSAKRAKRAIETTI